MGRRTTNRRTRSHKAGGITYRTTTSYGKNGPRTTYSSTSRSADGSSRTISSSYGGGKNTRSSTYNNGHGQATIWSSSSGGSRRGRRRKTSSNSDGGMLEEFVGYCILIGLFMVVCWSIVQTLVLKFG